MSVQGNEAEADEQWAQSPLLRARTAVTTSRVWVLTDAPRTTASVPIWSAGLTEAPGTKA